MESSPRTYEAIKQAENIYKVESVIEYSKNILQYAATLQPVVTERSRWKRALYKIKKPPHSTPEIKLIFDSNESVSDDLSAIKNTGGMKSMIRPQILIEKVSSSTKIQSHYNIRLNLYDYKENKQLEKLNIIIYDNPENIGSSNITYSNRGIKYKKNYSSSIKENYPLETRTLIRYLSNVNEYLLRAADNNSHTFSNTVNGGLRIQDSEIFQTPTIGITLWQNPN